MNFIKLALGAALGLPAWALACSSCGCTLSADWESQGISGKAGLRMDLRMDYIAQNQLRHGAGRAGADDVAADQAAGTLGETEQSTTNRYYTLGLDYNFNPSWGLSLQLPWVDRSHGTLAAGDTDISSSHTRSLGDAKLIARYRGLSPDGDTGLLLGVKLPTGGHGENFSSGPMAGSALDRSLQPGSGSTDLILGAYRFGSLNANWDWFAQGSYQFALSTQDGFRPGNALNLSLGARYMELKGWQPQVQINAKTGRRDSGVNSDPVNSGGEVVYLSPGATVPVGKTAKLYGFVQLPLYQRVEGFQLAPRWNASLGLNFGF